MSHDLIDFRGKLTPEAHAALEAEGQATGHGHAEIVREVMHEWAMRRIHAANVLNRQLAAKGLRGIDGGMSGNRGECEGKPAADAGRRGRAA